MAETAQAVGEGIRAGGPTPGVAGAGGPPPGVARPGGGGAPTTVEGTSSGFEGREEMLGRAVAIAIRTLKDSIPYQHEMNDALVKMHLNSVQFAKNKGMSAEYVQHDIRTMMPMLSRMKAIIERTGDREVALVGMFERTPCLYQLCLDLDVSPGRRTFTFPFTHVLEISRKIGQFDLTDEELHDIWLRPRLLGYAEAMGVKIQVSDIGPDHKVTVSLAD
jgi:hypothetical protein